MTSSGKVRVWHHEQGWGVIDCPEAPGGCWAHYSTVLVGGYKALQAGQSVELIVEAAQQDGYGFRAVEVWPSGQAPRHPSPDAFGPSDAYNSTLGTTFTSDPAGDAGTQI